MIENSIRTYALSQSVLTSLIAAGLHLTTKHKSDDNYVVLQVINDSSPTDLHFQSTQKEASVQFDCYSKNPLTCQQISAAVKAIFHTKKFTDADVNVQFALEQNRLPDFDNETGLHRNSLDYTFYYNEV